MQHTIMRRNTNKKASATRRGAGLVRLGQRDLGLGAGGLAAIRARLSLGPLGDAAPYARGLEAAWRLIWRDWCARQGGR